MVTFTKAAPGSDDHLLVSIETVTNDDIVRPMNAPQWEGIKPTITVKHAYTRFRYTWELSLSNYENHLVALKQYFKDKDICTNIDHWHAGIKGRGYVWVYAEL